MDNCTENHSSKTLSNTVFDRISNIKKEDYFIRANLHTHSNSSDGKEDFDTLIQRAENLGLEYFSICDHNTVEGYKNSKLTNSPLLITGAEFDCFYATSLIHILGYGIDFKHPEIDKICTKNKQETKLDIIRLFHSRHPADVIKAIHKAGGIAVLAHPCCCSVFSLTSLVKKLKTFGLDGIETYYPYNRHRGIIKFHSRKKPFELAEKYNLIQTGGTDEHGTLKISKYGQK